MNRHEFTDYGSILLIGLFAVLLALEARFQLRRRVQHFWLRLRINALVSIPSYILLRILLIPVMILIALKNEKWRIGLEYAVHTDYVTGMLLGLLLLDYSNYLWHIVLHKWPLMWRFHLVHHTDLELDVSTSLRFHFGELIGSVFFRGAFVFILGVTHPMVLTYELLFEAATQFQHSNWKLPIKLERMLNWVLVTPRMHGIHHSMYKRQTDSNYSIVFSVWDRLHHTLQLHIPQQSVPIGVAAYAEASELTVEKLLKLPFTSIRNWKKEFLGSQTAKTGSKTELAE